MSHCPCVITLLGQARLLIKLKGVLISSSACAADQPPGSPAGHCQAGHQGSQHQQEEEDESEPDGVCSVTGW